MEFTNLTKQELLDLICETANIDARFKVGVGSSIPSDFFRVLQDKYSSINTTGMENIAALICHEYGVEWTSECDSSFSPSGGGGTVTKTGLIQLLQAIRLAVAREE